MPLAPRRPVLLTAPDIGTTLGSFDRLPHNGRLTLVLDRAPDALLRDLREARPHLFDWWLLEAGPTQWRVQIVRRVIDPGQPRNIADYLENDHARLRALLDTAGALIAEGHRADAVKRMAEVRLGLTRHCQAIEVLLLPRVEAFAMFGEDEVGACMRDSHREVRERLESLLADAGDWRTVAPHYIALGNALALHVDIERRRLYPLLDAVLSPLDHDEAVRLMQSCL